GGDAPIRQASNDLVHAPAADRATVRRAIFGKVAGTSVADYSSLPVDRGSAERLGCGLPVTLGIYVARSDGAARKRSVVMSTEPMQGAELLIKALVDQGVEVIFGYPGGAVLPIYDALFKQNRLRHILVRHEQAAVHAAEGYARSTGKVGCVLVTSGPGATNAVTGLTDALMDSIPVVCLTGQVPTHLIGNDAFQEADTTGITRPCTKHNYLVKDVRDLARTVHEAF